MMSIQMAQIVEERDLQSVLASSHARIAFLELVSNCFASVLRLFFFSKKWEPPVRGAPSVRGAWFQAVFTENGEQMSIYKIWAVTFCFVTKIFWLKFVSGTPVFSDTICVINPWGPFEVRFLIAHCIDSSVKKRKKKDTSMSQAFIKLYILVGIR